MGSEWSETILERLLGGLQNGVWEPWRALRCHVEAQDNTEILKILEKYRSERQAFPQRCHSGFF